MRKLAGRNSSDSAFVFKNKKTPNLQKAKGKKKSKLITYIGIGFFFFFVEIKCKGVTKQFFKRIYNTYSIYFYLNDVRRKFMERKKKEKRQCDI